MREFVIILLFFNLLIACDRPAKPGKILDIPTYPNDKKDTSYWYKLQRYEFKVIGLPDLSKSEEDLHFRFSTDNQAIDIWRNKSSTYYGILTNFTSEAEDRQNYLNKFQDATKFFSNQRDIDTATARSIYDIFDRLKIFDIPNEDKISGWRLGGDGVIFAIECSTLAKYTYKTYWTPSYYKNKIKEAAVIDSLSNQLQHLLCMPDCFWQFLDGLPECWYHFGAMEAIYNKHVKLNKK